MCSPTQYWRIYCKSGHRLSTGIPSTHRESRCSKLVRADYARLSLGIIPTTFETISQSQLGAVLTSLNSDLK
jgi:hypothetical protein